MNLVLSLLFIQRQLTPTNKFFLLKIQEMSLEKQMQTERKVKVSGEMFTGIGIMNRSVKNSALADKSLISY